MKAAIWTLACAALLVAGPASRAAAASQNAAVKPTDSALDERIERRVHDDAALKKYDIDVSVNGGVVTLTGTVATDAQKARAENLARVRGVTRVDNKITVDKSARAKGTTGTIAQKTKEGAEKTAEKTKEVAGKAVEKTKEGISKTGEVITDAWITTRVKSRFIGEDVLKGSDINVDTDDHVVTLKGTVPSAAGRARAIAIAKDTEGVRRVVDRLTVAPKA